MKSIKNHVEKGPRLLFYHLLSLTLSFLNIGSEAPQSVGTMSKCYVCFGGLGLFRVN